MVKKISELEKRINKLMKRIEKLEKHTHITEVGHNVGTPIIPEE